MFAFARAKICQFDNVSLNENILGFDIAMKNAFPMHEVDGLEDLEHIEFDLLVSEGVFFVF